MFPPTFDAYLCFDVCGIFFSTSSAALRPGWLHQKQRTGEVVLGGGPQPEPRREEEFTPAWVPRGILAGILAGEVADFFCLPCIAKPYNYTYIYT